jgi:hypothetical protein
MPSHGLLVFAVALMMLFAAHRVISLIWKSGPAAPQDVAHQKAVGLRRHCACTRMG